MPLRPRSPGLVVLLYDVDKDSPQNSFWNLSTDFATFLHFLKRTNGENCRKVAGFPADNYSKRCIDKKMRYLCNLQGLKIPFYRKTGKGIEKA